MSIDKNTEEAVTGSLEVVAAAAAPFFPWGTVASVVVVAGVQIYKAAGAIDKAQTELSEKLNNIESQIDYAKTIKSTFEKAGKRPIMPLDLYSGPPMYWIVNPPESEPIENSQYYRLPNGDVEWPCGSQGGFYAMANTNKDGINTDNVYAPFPPTNNNKPEICIFFWAVPIFFARLQQIIGENRYGNGYDPKKVLPSGKTIESELASLIKSILKEGRLDAAGNWFAKIGPVIPAIANNDDDFAARYYGRSTWVHNLAMQNIKFADGSRIASSGVKYSKNNEYFSSPAAKQAMELSARYSAEKPRFVEVVGKPYYLKNFPSVNANTPVMNSGNVLDLQSLVSRYDKVDGTFAFLRNGLISSPQSDNDNLYYVVSIPTNNTIVKTENAFSFPLLYRDRETWRLASDALMLGGNWNSGRVSSVGSQSNGTTVNKLVLYSSDFYKMIIRNSGGFNMLGTSTMLGWSQYDPVPNNKAWNQNFIDSRVHGKFALAPFMLYVAAKCETINGMNHPRPYIGPPYTSQGGASDSIHTTYGFFDFDPELFSQEKIPGLWDGVTAMGKFDWIRNLAIMPGFNADPTKSKSEDYKYTTSIATTGLENAWSWAGSYVDMGSDITTGIKLESFAYRTFSVNDPMTGINEIIKLRPPIAGEPTIKLKKQFWGEGEPWAKLKGTDEVDFALRNGSGLYVFKFSREPLGVKIDATGTKIKEKPLTRAYFRTNLEENKPIVEIDGRSNPSPFYCGRRADPRTKLAWRKIRLASTNQQDSSHDSGWEDCHEWSWPYSTSILSEVGRISGKLYAKHGEGIGRAGCSPSSIATGPTVWGDAALFISRYDSLKGGSSNPNDPGFSKFKAKAMWQAVMEMQAGAYSRYSFLANNLNATFAEDLQKQFSRYGNKSQARESFLQDAKKGRSESNPPKVWNESLKRYVILSDDQAADLCISVVDSWFNGTFPKPSDAFQQKFNKSDWDYSLLEDIADAHIRLKNWALDWGLPASRRKGFSFPGDVFNINFFGLNKANRTAIESLNSIVDSNAVVTNPLQIGINQTLNSEKNVSTGLNQGRLKPRSEILNPPVIVTAAAALLTVAIIAKLKGRK